MFSYKINKIYLNIVFFKKLNSDFKIIYLREIYEPLEFNHLINFHINHIEK
jgi:hypothetical protein